MSSATAQSQGRLFKRLAVAAARAADDKKAGDVVVLHVRPVSGVADYVVVASCPSTPQLEAVEENVKRVMKEDGLLPRHRDGRLSNRWRVLDYGGLIVHLMHPEAREHYRIEAVFAGAKRVKWEAEHG